MEVFDSAVERLIGRLDKTDGKIDVLDEKIQCIDHKVSNLKLAIDGSASANTLGMNARIYRLEESRRTGLSNSSRVIG